MLVYAFVGAVVFFALLPVGQRLWTRLPLPDAYSPWFLLLAGWILATSVFSFVGRTLDVRRSQMALALRHPPTWLAVLASAALVGVLFALNRWPCDPTLVAASAGDAAMLASSAIVGLMVGHLPWVRPPTPPALVATKGATLSWQALHMWVARERPSAGDEPDLFDRSNLVRRLVDRLRRPWAQDAYVSVLGGFGTGKSSVLARAKEQLSTPGQPKIWICEVSAWGLESASALPVHVIAAMIETVDEHVDCRALRGLPRAYERLISAEPTGFFAKILEGFGTASWEIQLRQLSPLLKAVDARLVLFLEDAERAGDSFDPQHIQRLLLVLRSVEGISFVIAADTERAAGFDVLKVSDHVEQMPTSVDPNHVRRVLRVLRDHCRTDFDFIDPLKEERGKDPLDLREPANSVEDYARARYRNSLADAMTDLIPTPRRLKHVVREVDEAWQLLHGELDLDDLIVATVLKLGAPECFEFLLRHIDTVREKHREWPQEGEQLEKDWKAQVERTPRAGAVQKLVDFLALETIASPNQKVRPQGIQNNDPTDYFRRLRDRMVGGIRDQSVLADLEAWRTKRRGPLLTNLLGSTEEDRDYVRAWEHVALNMSDEELLQLGDEVIAALKTRDGVRSSAKHPALLALWRRCHRSVGATDRALAWLGGHLESALETSLTLANQMYYFWASIRYSIVTGAGRRSVREAMVRRASELYADPEALWRVLDKDHPWEIRHLLRPEDQDEPASALIDPAEWRWLANTLLRLAASKGGDAGPFIAQAIGEFRQQHTLDPEQGLAVNESYNLDRVRAQALFGEELPEILTYLADLDDGVEPWYLRAARLQAKEWRDEMAVAH